MLLYSPSFFGLLTKFGEETDERPMAPPLAGMSNSPGYLGMGRVRGMCTAAIIVNFTTVSFDTRTLTKSQRTVVILFEIESKQMCKKNVVYYKTY